MLIAEILAVVPVSYWSFARFANRSPGDQVLVADESANPHIELDQLREELLLQREQTPKGRRLSPTLVPLSHPFVSGIALVFADMRREFGILTLFRDGELGAFTSFEIQALALALDASVDRLAGFSVTESPAAPQPFPTLGQPTMHVLDTDLKVVFTWDTPDGRTAWVSGVEASIERRLPAVIERAIQDLVAGWTSDPSTQGAGTLQPVPFLTVRAQPLTGPTGLFIGVIVERAARSRVFDAAAQTFKLSTRELETLAMLLQGAELKDIARALHIVPSTVQDHVKNMLEKTGARNRSEMIAKLLNLPSDAAN